MGEPIPTPPIDYADDCPACTIPAGPLWEAGETPEYMYVYFDGIKKCFWFVDDPPNGLTFKLHQHETNKCLWLTEWGLYRVFLYMALGWPLGSKIQVLDSGNQIHFHADSVPCPEETHIFNNTPGHFPPPPDFPEGVAVIHWMGIVLGLVLAFSLPTASTIMHEIFLKDEVQVVHKFCFPKYGMNVKMLMSP